MNIPKPNPKIYRLAAKLVDGGQETHSCYAIEAACQEYGMPDGIYRAQYRAMFAGSNVVSHVEPSGYDTYRVVCASPERLARQNGHPFWDLDATPERQKMRILALLLMADICEQGG